MTLVAQKWTQLPHGVIISTLKSFDLCCGHQRIDHGSVAYLRPHTGVPDYGIFMVIWCGIWLLWAIKRTRGEVYTSTI